MKLSTKGRYGLRAMVDLAVHSSADAVSIKSIAERQQISENYLEQVFSVLRKTGLVKSIKGAQGGYILAQEPSKIRVGDVLEVMEGNLEVVETGDEFQKGNSLVETVIASQVWDKINSCINEVVFSITLQDLVDEYKKRNSDQGYMYYI
ncbi:Rrf2 family transcriptional regulator [Clostridium thermosuccinogenes]|jgi:Rrf2 family protein|uniref:Rrf2 family transcriptional regulator n=1 Tax=Clostridium thermosuccinogenes TaxID=84032 RepID=A0A2K2FN06_9CLOT|nr:Rrf2 family transcriptional regulator [Pseudoclostridium thermosuccinogenes]AUS97859.1 Rrf2 family transcriptional regulator [Pseudoclostridium thermosuccinogenes]PNT94109.1 Rrf2 family transcriptional regulator [Pseudoclostridium thermosuccinogenes]PNU00156.1 Rrf2 family transcriptional regulator [Pseudoclostridium thermosuccinogenes]PNU01480.1 Rrf2 family transcriptional regulator [Pseudoclostridium thermosuccinogenes]